MRAGLMESARELIGAREPHIGPIYTTERRLPLTPGPHGHSVWNTSTRRRDHLPRRCQRAPSSSHAVLGSFIQRG